VNILCRMSVLSLISVMQFVCELLYRTLSYCFVYLSHFFLCTRFTFCYSFYDCFFFVPFASALCVLYFPLSCTLLLLMYICSFLFVYSFTNHCHRVKSQLQLINIIHSFKRRESLAQRQCHVLEDLHLRCQISYAFDTM
jgi:hypothetical protein